MALPLPSTSKEITQRAKVDVRREIAVADPFPRRSYLGAIVTGLANRVFEFYAALREVELEGNPQTAVRNLKRWASIWRIYTLPGSPASGSIWATCNFAASGSLVPAGTRFVSGGGGVYLSTVDVSFSLVTKALSSLTASAGVATAVSVDHGFGANAVLGITGASVAGFNISGFPVTIVDKDTFTFPVDAALSGSAGGSPQAVGYGATIPIVSEGTGADLGQDPGAPLTWEAGTPPNVSSPALVTAPGLVDGTDIESDDELRARMLFRIRNPTAHFNVADIVAKAREVAGVTRVFVQEVTPDVGQVTIYFLRDGDSTPIPSPAEVLAVKTAILAIKPASLADADMIVAAPTAVPQAFTFTALSPNTASMRDAIRATLAEFFKLRTSVGVSVAQDAYRSAIFNTRDPVTGDPVASFTLSAPAGAISVSAGQIATLGTVSF